MTIVLKKSHEGPLGTALEGENQREKEPNPIVLEYEGMVCMWQGSLGCVHSTVARTGS